jgi:hypothetical protein
MLNLGSVEAVNEAGNAEMVQVAGSSDTQAEVVQYYRSLLENRKVHVGQTGSGMGIIQVQTQAPFPKSIMTMHVPAVAAGDASGAGTAEAARR